MRKTDDYGLRTAATNEHGTDYFNVKIMCRQLGDSFPTNPSTGVISSIYPETPNKVRGLCLDGLTIRAHVYKDADGCPIWIGIDWKYRDVYSIDGRTAKAMTKTLAKIEREAEKIGGDRRQLDRYPNWEREVLVQVMAAKNALGLKWIAEPSNPNVPLYSDTSWEFHESVLQFDILQEMRNQLDRVSTQAA